MEEPLKRVFVDARECVLLYILSAPVSSFLRLHTPESNRFRFAGARFIASTLEAGLIRRFKLNVMTPAKDVELVRQQLGALIGLQWMDRPNCPESWTGWEVYAWHL